MLTCCNSEKKVPRKWHKCYYDIYVLYIIAMHLVQARKYDIYNNLD